MPVVVNKNQQVITAGLKPASDYSRVIVVSADVNLGGGWGYGYSPVFGKNTRLLEVQVDVILEPGGANTQAFFRIFQGVGVPQRYQDVTDWNKIIDFGRYGDYEGMVSYGDWRHFSWSMNKLYSTEANRFGLVLQSNATNAIDAYAFFKISEG